jgi:hypothetical protein
MRPVLYIFITLSLLLTNSCITPFFPDADETEELLVVQGLITDQPGAYTVNLSRSQPLGYKITDKPVTGCTVLIEDDLGHSYPLHESEPGTYITDPEIFCGEIGRKYTLRITEQDSAGNFISYQSLPEEMRPVPPIDSIYYEKVEIPSEDPNEPVKEGCQIYLDTDDKDGICKYYRWDYSETWKFKIPFDVDKQMCWKTANSDIIDIKNTAVLSQNKINRYPVAFVSTETDRLSLRYSILVNQYSISEEEYNYWEKLQNISVDVGGLYDVIPASIPGNISCLQKPAEKVLGYFSVSAKMSKRIFIQESFKGFPNFYAICHLDTVSLDTYLPPDVMIISTREPPDYPPPWYRIITDYPWCYDCTYSGTLVKPDFWVDK